MKKETKAALITGAILMGIVLFFCLIDFAPVIAGTLLAIMIGGFVIIGIYVVVEGMIE